MSFSEFRRLLGAEPRSQDPAFRLARDSAPEFAQAAAEAEVFEDKLESAARLPCPDRLLEDLQALPQGPARRARWMPMALAASLLVAVGATAWFWQLNPSWASVDAYLVDHYRHDGQLLIDQADGSVSAEATRLLEALNLHAAPALTDIIGVIKYCPTPDGKGVHMVLNTPQGPVTLIYMPETHVTDGEMLGFDRVEALLVDLPNGSAAIIGTPEQDIRRLYAKVHGAIETLPARS